MISVDIAGVRFNLRAGAIIEHEGKVLLHRLIRDDFWTLPGGRVEPDEDAPKTVEREMLEELGEAVRCGNLVMLIENFFSAGGQRNHELGLYFQTHLAVDSALPDLATPFAIEDGGARLEFDWFSREQLGELRILPLPMKDMLISAERSLRHVINRE
ncbi:NUDIX hydrolase [Chromobacterium sp. IIBBL 290-4]|uniref:NUDIX hydrolase n=1 Tax=Chromobacterium sp. IIBBL 290-4 TaxID=2953890 RepID=UPI0020B73A3E|nr:NUDIX domain-containing protein [Chromobacterium sp. IIBBL 290-4]UTH72924.1 NUDIX domain-containing protein [Chromobacterium sp. IIBBL 290-4]